MDTECRLSGMASRRGLLLHTRSRVPDITIAAMMGLGVDAFTRFRRTADWPERPARRRVERRGRPTVGRTAAVGVRNEPQPKSRDTEAALETFITGRLRAYEAELAAGRDPDPERLARAVTQLVRALVMLRRHVGDPVEERDADDAGAPARSLSELRDELRGHLQRIRLEGRARRGLAEAGADPE